MTEWTVERDAVGWSVVAWRNGARVEPRARLYGLSCIAAQVIAAELDRAYGQGRDDEREEVRRAIFS